ncbi:MAG TPA: inorganic diphosphatase [Candidatus Andersenbacteria bacterium]|nr:inorganic diphosphatase [Candidatus Andersenbacteria bacterium]
MKDSSSKSLEIAKAFLGKEVEIIIDRPIGSRHPKYDFVYEVNYGYIPDTPAPDGKNLDAYYIGTAQPQESVQGMVVAIIHRLEDDDDKLVVLPKGKSITDEEIEKAVEFQEKWFKHEIVCDGMLKQ